jgi:hypothetical protein
MQKENILRILLPLPINLLPTNASAAPEHKKSMKIPKPRYPVSAVEKLLPRYVVAIFNRRKNRREFHRRDVS